MQSRNRDTDVENKCTDTKTGKKGGGMNSEIGIDIYTQLILSVKYNKDKLMLPKGKDGEEG